MSEEQDKNLLRMEKRVIRPFAGVESFDGLIRGVTVSVNGQILTSDVHALDENQFADLNLAFDISLRKVEVELAASEIFAKLEDLDLVVIAYAKTFRNSEVIRRWNLGRDDIDQTFTFHSSDLPDIIQDKFRGFSFVVAIVLSEDRTPEPLKVYQAGTWLVKREFSFGPNRETSLFAPSPMDAAKKDELKIPRKTLIYIMEGDESIEFATHVHDAITVWVDSEVLLSLQKNPTPASEIVQMLLARTAIGAVVDLISKVFDEKNFDFERLAQSLSKKDDSEDNVLQKFVRKAHKVVKNTEYMDTISELRTDAQKVAAKMEADADLLGEIKRALAKEEA